MKDLSPATAGTVKPRKLIIDVRRRCDVLRQIEAEQSYDACLRELSEIARDTRRAIEKRRSGAVKTGGEVIKEWRRQKRIVAELFAKPGPTYSAHYHSSEPTTQPARTRSNVGCKTTSALPRSRSREQSHAPRSTPKAAKRSGDSGDSSDPPGSSPAALAVLLLFLLREMSS